MHTFHAASPASVSAREWVVANFDFASALGGVQAGASHCARERLTHGFAAVPCPQAEAWPSYAFVLEHGRAD